MQRLLTSLFIAFILVGCTSQPDVVFTSPQYSSSSSNQKPVTSQPALRLGSGQTTPKSVLIKVPFAPQAPLANWDPAHEEACEEMSMILVDHYLAGTTITREQAEQELQKLLKWEDANGYSQDVTAQEMARIAKDYFKHNATVLNDVTIPQIKEQIAKGNPVIVPAAGRKLGNPYYSGEGPWYHVLVAVGYDSDEFITNDVGTKRGDGYRYDQESFLHAIHDWTGVKEEIEQGRKSVVIMTK